MIHNLVSVEAAYIIHEYIQPDHTYIHTRNVALPHPTTPTQPTYIHTYIHTYIYTYLHTYTVALTIKTRNSKNNSKTDQIIEPRRSNKCHFLCFIHTPSSENPT